MPTLIARIFTSHPANADSIAQALKQQGYLVEVLRPEQTTVSDADLEIVLETCASGDAVRRAAELAHDNVADVAVAPGTLTWAPVAPALHDPALHDPALHDEDLHDEDLHAVAEAAPQLPIESGLEAALDEAPETYRITDLPVMESLARKSGVPMREKRAPGALARAIPRMAVTLAAWAASAREALVTARDQVNEYREHALARIALVRANREARLLELTQRRIEAQEHASQLATARKNAAAYLLQLQQESGGVIRPTNRGISLASGAEPRVRPWRVLFEGLLERVRPIRWDAALAGIASAGALFAIGLAVASFTSRPTVTLGNEPPAAATPEHASATNAQQPPATINAAATPAKPAVARVRSRKPSPGQHTRSARNRADAGSEDGNDVVVRHLASPSPNPKVQAQGWKHFSDIDH